MNSPSLCVKDVRNILHELKKFQKDYTEKFRTKTRNLKEQALQNFISDSPWDEKPVIEQIQLDVTNLIGDKTNGSIHIDE
ncbi:MAG: hypothetical protein ABIH80_04510 [Methanobacteriota archaeon]